MVSGTRGREDLKWKRHLLGLTSKPWTQTDLPCLRDLLSAGLLEKERIEGEYTTKDSISLTITNTQDTSLLRRELTTKAYKILDFLKEVNQLDNVKIIGGESTNAMSGSKD